MSTIGSRYATTIGALVPVLALAAPAVAAPGEPAATEPVAFSVALPVGRDFLDVAAGDMNGDGTGDLVGATSDLDEYGALYVLLGDGAGGFTQSTRLDPVGTQPIVVLADFNNDGRLDVAVGDDDGTSGGILLFFGDGAGSFGATRVIPGMSLVTELSAGDFDGDGNADLAAYLLEPNRIGVVYGNGRGRFTLPVILARNATVDDLLVADVSGDGRDDVVVSRLDRDAVAVAASRGRTFDPVRSYPTGDNPSALAAADVDGDGDLDLLTITGAGFDDFADLTLLRGVGDGRFGPPETDPDVGSPVDIAAATDMNADGLVDVVLVEARPFAGRDAVTVRLGDGTGNFGTPSQFFADAAFPNVVADLAGDAKPDVVAGGVGSSDTALRINITGQATLSAPDVAVVEGAGPATFTVRRSASSTSSTVRYQTVAGSATAPADYTATSGTLRFAAGERVKTVLVPIVDDAVPEVEESFTLRLTEPVGAGLLDPIAEATIQDNDLTLPPVSFGEPIPLTDSAGLGSALTTGDLDGDGNPDLVQTDGGFVNPALVVSLGNGSGVGPPTTYEAAPGQLAVTTADLDADGNLDVITGGGASGGTVTVYLGDGTGAVAAGIAFPVGGGGDVAGMDVGELTGGATGDGELDVVVRTVAPTGVFVLPGDGAGGLEAARKIGAGGSGRLSNLRVADLDNNGADDVVLATLVAGTVTTLLQSAAGGDFEQANYPVSADPAAVAVADFDTDGFPDVAVHAGVDVNTGEDLVALFLVGADGGLAAPTTWRLLGGDSILEAADYNGDGRADLASVGGPVDGAAVLRGNGAGGFAAYTEIEPGVGYLRGTTTDFNSDGLPDLVLGNNAKTDLLLNTSG